MTTFSDNFNAGTPGNDVDTAATWANNGTAAGNRLTYQTGAWGSQGALHKAGATVLGDLIGESASGLPTTPDQKVSTFVALSTIAGAGPYVEVRLRWDTANSRYVSAKVYEDKTEIIRNGVVLATWTYAVVLTGFQGWVQFEANGDNLRFWLENVAFGSAPNFARAPDLEVLDLVVTGAFNWGVRVLFSGIDTWVAADITQIPPTTPSITTKTDLNSLNMVPVSLTAAAFTSNDPAASHAATRWQIDVRGGDFNPPQVEDEIDPINLTLRTFFLLGVTNFDARVAYQDSNGNWSAFSSAFQFTTASAFTPGSGTPPTPPPDVFPTLSLNPSYVLTEGYQSQTLVTTGDSGVERRRAKFSVPKRTFGLRYNVLSTTDADLLWAFYVSMNGRHKAFQWTHPLTAVAIAVRFVDDHLTRELWEHTIYRVGLQLVETWLPDNASVLP